MTDAQRIIRVKSFFDTGVLSDDDAFTYLAIAKDTILNRLYPFESQYPVCREIPLRYEGLWCELAARYFARRGGLGEINHSENGISRTWYSSDDRDILSRIVPKAIVR